MAESEAPVIPGSRGRGGVRHWIKTLEIEVGENPIEVVMPALRARYLRNPRQHVTAVTQGLTTNGVALCWYTPDI